MKNIYSILLCVSVCVSVCVFVQEATMSCQEEIIAAIISDSPHRSSREFLCDADLSFNA